MRYNCNVHSVRLRLVSIEQSSVPLERRRLEKQQSSAQKIGRLHGKQQSDKQQSDKQQSDKQQSDKQQSDKQKMRVLLAKLRRSVHVCGKSAQSSVQLCSGLQRTAPIVHRLECRAQRKMQQLSRLPGAWLSSCSQRRRPSRMPQKSAVCTRAQLDARPRPKGMFGGPLQGIGAVEAAEVVVGMHHSSHHRHHHQRHSRRHHSLLQHRRLRHRLRHRRSRHWRKSRRLRLKRSKEPAS